ncbi:GNAT family N-acetyltransferase [Halobaculum sp. CBA1158]|uniref:GNAT family N-acetyltransferase n=1 Tax=Halobaculum sp. CBA1158 TaxID=2904243 RepID=UPI001F246D3D|nr:GNAT family N-acetyltransferase [Halobaculum sp. CBA1158]UIP01116.1 GNAT family N-acetyltransferase [Halobaculum sp. CBA1158]
MQIRSLTREEVDAFVDELWIPFQREAAADEPFYPLANDVREPGVSHREERLSDDDAADRLAVASDGDFAGFASAKREEPPPVFDRGPNCHVSELYVVEARRREGIATELLEACTERAREWGCETASISVAAGNDAARALYEREGFAVRRRRLMRRVE